MISDKFKEIYLKLFLTFQKTILYCFIHYQIFTSWGWQEDILSQQQVEESFIVPAEAETILMEKKLQVIELIISKVYESICLETK